MKLRSVFFVGGAYRGSTGKGVNKRRSVRSASLPSEAKYESFFFGGSARGGGGGV